MADKPDSSTENRGKTPPEWDFPDDGRNGSMVYPQFDGTRTRSGHVLIFDDTKDREHITLQHRTGTMFQFLPDGALHIVAHKGQFIQVFGESRVKITGAQDITVDGDASMKVKGAQNITVDGDVTMAVKGKYTVTAQSMNMTIAEQMDTVAGSETKKIDGSSTTQVVGAVSIMSKGGALFGSTGDDVGIGSAKNLGLVAAGTLSAKSTGQTSIKAAGPIALDGSTIHQNSGNSLDAVTQVRPAKPAPASSEPDVSTA